MNAVSRFAVGVTLLAFAAGMPATVFAAQGKRAAKPVAVESTPLDMRKVAYAELEQHVGAELVIRTIHDTSRRGTLTRFTNVTLTLQLGAEQGAIELSVPRETIREILLVVVSADPVFPEISHNEGNSGAKKN